MLQIVIPMAGRGERFAQAGYQIPKPFLPVFGRPLIQRVIENHASGEAIRFHLVHRDLPENKEPLRQLIRDVPQDIRLIPLAQDTQGAAETVLRALEDLPDNDELLISNSDQIVDFSFDQFLAAARQATGCLITFHSDDPKWSFAATDGNGQVTAVAEKKVISHNATVGIYYFRRIGDFRSAARSMIAANDRVRNEFYVAPVYNYLDLKSRAVSIYPLDPAGGRMFGLGTPEDYEVFLKTDPFRWSRP